MTMPISDAIFDVLAGALLIVAALLTLAAAIGLIRFPDPLSRLHAATKPQVLGLILVVLALALSTRSAVVLLMLVPVVVLQLLTAPISAHMVGRAGYRNGDVDRDNLLVDELAPDVDAAGRTDLAGGAWGDEPAAEESEQRGRGRPRSSGASASGP
jgi:multicomponent Na+:H+ antiporter subunit G